EHPVVPGERRRRDPGARQGEEVYGHRGRARLLEPPACGWLAGGRSRQPQGPRAGVAEARRYQRAGERTADRRVVLEIELLPPATSCRRLRSSMNRKSGIEHQMLPRLSFIKNLI